MYSCLIIGLGNVGMGYDINSSSIQTHSKAINLHNKFILSGAVEVDKRKGFLFKKIFKKPVYKNIKTALKLIKPKIIIISTPTNTHLRVITQILKYYKPNIIVCEKPCGTSFNQSLNIVNLCKKNKIKLYVNFPRLSDPGVIKIKKKFLSGHFKMPVSGSVYYSRGALNNASHFLNTLEYWFGKIIRSKLINKGDKFSKFDQNSSFFLSFKMGNFLIIPTEDKNKFANSIEIFAKNGRLIYEKGGKKITWQKNITNTRYPLKFHKKKYYFYSGKKKSQLHFFNNLYNAINKKNCSICTSEKAIKTLKTIYSLYEK